MLQLEIRGVKFGRPINQIARERFLELYPLTRDKSNANYRTIVSVVEELNISRKQFYVLENKLIKSIKKRTLVPFFMNIVFLLFLLTYVLLLLYFVK